jgi:hypothetical protein
MQNKFRTIVGFGFNQEVEDCEWEDVVEEKTYVVEQKKNMQRFVTGATTSGELKITNSYEIVGNSYLFEHIDDIRYLVLKGKRHIVETAELIDTPRVKVTIGGIYNGPQPTAESSSEED